MNYAIFEKEFETATSDVMRVCSGLADASGFCEREFEQASLSTARCVLRLRRLSPLDATTESLSERVQDQLIHRFASFTFCGNNPKLQRLSLRVLMTVVELDPSRWLKSCTPCILSLLQSSNATTVHYALVYGVTCLIRLLRWSYRAAAANAEHLTPVSGHETAAVVKVRAFVSALVVETLSVCISEIQVLLIGKPLALELDSQLNYLKICPELFCSMSPRVGSLRGGALKMQLTVFKTALELLSNIIESVQVHSASRVHAKKQKIHSLTNACVVTLTRLLLYPVLPKCVAPSVMVLESVGSLLGSSKLRPAVFPALFPAFALAVYAVSEKRACPHHNPSVAAVKLLFSTAAEKSVILQLVSNYYETLRDVCPTYTIPKQLCCRPERTALRTVIALQFFKWLAAPNSATDLILDALISDGVTLITNQKHNDGTVCRLRERALTIAASGVFQKSLLSDAYELQLPDTFALSDWSDHDDVPRNNTSEKNAAPQFQAADITLKRDSDDHTCKLWPETREIDCVSWLTTDKSHKELIDLILLNFARQNVAADACINLKDSSGILEHEENLKTYATGYNVPQQFAKKLDTCDVPVASWDVSPTACAALAQQTIESKTYPVIPSMENQDTIEQRHLCELQVAIRQHCKYLMTATEGQDQDTLVGSAAGWSGKNDSNDNSETDQDVEDKEKAVDSDRVILGYTADEESSVLIKPTAINYLRHHAVAFQTVYFLQILAAGDDLSTPKNGEEKACFSSLEQNCSKELDVLRQLKMEVALRIAVNNLKTLPRDAQERLVIIMLTKIWEENTSTEKTSCLSNVSERHVSRTVDVLFSKFGHCVMQSGNLEQTFTDDALFGVLGSPRHAFIGPFGFTGLSNALRETKSEAEKLGAVEEQRSAASGVKTAPHFSDLDYNAYFALSLQHVLGVPACIISAELPFAKYTGHRCVAHSEYSRCVVRFFTEVPAVPEIGFCVLSELAFSTAVERKIVLAVLSNFLKATEKPTVNKRTAFRLILQLAYAKDLGVRQEALSFINRKLAYNPSALGHSGLESRPCCIVTSDGTRNWVWDNVAAVGPWIEHTASCLLRKMTSTFSGAMDASFETERRAASSTMEERIADEISAVVIDRTLETAAVDYDKLVHRYATLLSVLCSRRPALLGVFLDCYAAATRVSAPLAQAIRRQFKDTLEWVPADQLSSLFLLLERGSEELLPLYVDILTTMTRAAGTNHEAAPAASVVASEGLRLYKRLNCIDVVIPLLPCLPQSEAETLIQRIIATEDPLQPLAFVKGEQVLDLLFRSAATTANFEPLPFRCVVDALDVCVALAQGPTPIFPSQVFLTFLGQLVDKFVHSATSLPRLFGRLLLIAVLRLPGLCPAIVSEVFPSLFQEHRQDASGAMKTNVWDDQLAWTGVCAAFSRLWKDYVVAPCLEERAATSGSAATPVAAQLQKLLCGLPRTPFEALFQELQRTHSNTRGILVEFLFSNRENAATNYRATVPPHVFMGKQAPRSCLPLCVFATGWGAAPTVIFPPSSKNETLFQLPMPTCIPLLEPPLISTRIPSYKDTPVLQCNKSLRWKHKRNAGRPVHGMKKRRGQRRRYTRYMRYCFATQGVDYDKFLLAKRGVIPQRMRRVAFVEHVNRSSEFDIKRLLHPQKFF